MLDEALAVRAVREGDIERLRITYGLLEPRADAVLGILGLDDSEWKVGGVHE